jgi:hypothetical protein
MRIIQPYKEKKDTQYAVTFHKDSSTDKDPYIRIFICKS